MTLKVEQNPKKLWHGMTREGTARHEKTRQGTRRHGKAREGTGTRARNVSYSSRFHILSYEILETIGPAGLKSHFLTPYEILMHH